MKDAEEIKSLETIKINPYEIAKADDLDIGFRSILHNASLLLDTFTQSNHDFILGGDITIIQNKLALRIAPYVAFCKKTEKLYCNANETIINLEASNKIYDRIDVVCIGIQNNEKDWIEFKNEKRAKWDTVHVRESNSHPITAEEMYFGDFNKRQKQNVSVIIIRGDDNDEIAKKVGYDVVKIAEIKVKASRNMLGVEDVCFVSALTEGDKNNEWTQEHRRTFYIAPIKDALSRYFKIHKRDGDLKDGVVKATHLNLSSGDALTAIKISLGEDIIRKAGEEINGQFIYATPFESNEKLKVQIFSPTNIKKTLDIAFDLIVFLWNTFIKQGTRVYYAGKKHTDAEIKKTKEEFDSKLSIERTERQKADEKETKERIESITKEETERKEADNTERLERIAGDAKEKEEREVAIAKERNERIEADRIEKEARESAINNEIAERIKGDEESRKLAQEAYKFSLPIGTFEESYSNDGMEGFLELNGESFDKEKYPLFYKYWTSHLSEFGTDYNDNPILPLAEKEDYSRLGELVTFIGKEYHDEFLICDGSPFSPNVYRVFYEQYWKKYLSYLGTEKLTGWPLRPTLNSIIAGSNIYIKVLPHIKNEWVTPFIKTGD